ncbi:ADP-ribosylation factor-binding protein GGA3-like isoform X1 [Simochromis diagramma]|uniref:ADP-ribosylation factor-binding protein GGA3-like isoform X1 n=2 Tax=Simochromis diagramma TaxID=43689 RepID=UPI001A7EC114|nr:ADP-ribosylation factor-binding protein GGA3-like isoform X1 [Simochromis diagramma]
MADYGESLESWLNKATNPSNRQEDWEYIMSFCDQINKELEGPQISVRLLAYKIQSPQEWEAMQALTVLEACMKNCGRRFHNEVGKFKFLNELIKVVSPKYLGDKVSEQVKKKVIEMLYSWTVSLPDETKIAEAYQMLKLQGIVLADPEIPLDATLIPSPSPRPKNPVFEDEKKSKRLSELLKSKKPEDLQEANRLIKNMVKEDEVRTQKATKQKSTLEAVNNSVKLLNEMLAHFNPEDSTDADRELIRELYGDCDKLRQTVVQLATETEDNDSSLGDILQANDDLSQVINLYKKIVEGQTMNGETGGRQTQTSVSAGTGSTNQSEILIDLVGLDIQSSSASEQQPPASEQSFPADLLCGSAATDPPSQCVNVPSTALSLLDEELLSLGLNEPITELNKSTHGNPSNPLPSTQDSSQDLDLFDTLPTVPVFSTPSLFLDALSTTGAPANPSKTYTPASSLNFTGPVFSTPLASTTSLSTTPISTTSLSTTSVISPQPFSSILTTVAPAAPPQSFSLTSSAPSAANITPQLISTSTLGFHSPSLSPGQILQDLTLLDLGNNNSLEATSTQIISEGIHAWSAPLSIKSQADDSPLLRSLSPVLPLSQSSPGRGQEVSLANVFVPLDTIKPSKVCPVTAYDKNGVRVLLHFATDFPPGRPDVLVMVASMLNTATQPVKNIVLQAAVPRTMKVKLQPPSGTELASFNPILPPAAITQIMLLANPLKEKVRMRYKLGFTLGDQPFTEVGEVNDFPPVDKWGAL